MVGKPATMARSYMHILKTGMLEARNARSEPQSALPSCTAVPPSTRWANLAGESRCVNSVVAGV
jgi:hypothetical protein